MSLTRRIVILVGLVTVLAFANHAIRQRQAVVESGRELLLELRPVDPRSLIQGDYMALAYHRRAFPDPSITRAVPREGRVVLKLDGLGVGRFARLDDGGPLDPDELRLRYRVALDSGELRYGAESFHFQEGRERLYADARYGILRVAPDGLGVLIGLADEWRRPITPPPSQPVDRGAPSG